MNSIFIPTLTPSVDQPLHWLLHRVTQFRLGMILPIFLTLALTPLQAATGGGTIIFDNDLGGRVGAPIYDVDGLTPLSGDAFRAVLYGGPSTTTMEPIGLPLPFKSGIKAGYVDASMDPDRGERTLSTVPPGGLAYVQVRAWDSSHGATYDEALAASGSIGSSKTILVIVGGPIPPAPPLFPGELIGLQSFKLTSPSSALPSPPMSLTATAVASSEIELSWVDTAEDEEGFRIHRWDPNLADWREIGQTETDITLFIDGGLEPSTQYYYRVAAFNFAGLSDYSNPADVTTFEGDPPAAPTNVSASNGLSAEYVEITWVFPVGANTFSIWRNTLNDSTTAVQISPVEVSVDSYRDTSAEPDVDYWYWVEAINAYGSSALGGPAVGRKSTPGVAPEPPTGINATDGTIDGGVEIDWNPVAAATHYEVWRSTTQSPANLISTIPPTEPFYFDATAAIGTAYYYWVKAVSADGSSSFSAPNSGYAMTKATGTVEFTNRFTDRPDPLVYDVDQTTPLPGTNFLAALFAGPTADSMVTVGQPVPFHGHPTRAGTFLGGARAIPNVIAGQTAYVQVRAWEVFAGNSYEEAVINGGKTGASMLFTVVTGNAGLPPSFPALLHGLESFHLTQPASPPPSAPTSLSASDGTQLGAVRLTWISANLASNYQVWRNISDDPSTALVITPASWTNLEFSDTTALPGKIHYYWVTAANEAGTSAFSTSDFGFRPLAKPLVSSVTQGSSPDSVDVVWTTVLGALHYEVRRANTPDVLNAALVANDLATTSLADPTATPGILYYYWVKAVGTDFDSAMSGGVSGYRAILAPSALTASQGAHPDHINLHWNPVWGSSSYLVWRNSVDDPATADLISAPGYNESSFTDMTAAPGARQYYWVQAQNGLSLSLFSPLAMGFTQIPPPTSVTASDAIANASVQVTWNPIATATEYEVWRNTVEDTATAQQVSGPGLNVASFVDVSAQPGVLYYYWVKAKNTLTTSAFSAPDTGSAQLPAPANLVAADGTDPGQVLLSWDPVSAATEYEVWRHTIDESATATIISAPGLATASYTDDSAQPGVLYYYWVKAKNTLTTSAFSAPDTGFSALGAPRNLTASDGIDPNVIQIAWDTVEVEAEYEVWRNASDDSATALLLSAPGQVSASFTDAAAEPGVLYHYWVKAKSLLGVSAFSAPDTGYLALKAAAGLTATDGTDPNAVTLRWTAVVGALTYEVWRGSIDDLQPSEMLSSGHAQTTFVDTTALPGSTYSYWVLPRNTETAGPFSQPDQGYLLGLVVSDTAPGFLTFAWPGSGRLQYQTDIGGEWRDVESENNSVIVEIDNTPFKAFRILQE